MPSKVNPPIEIVTGAIWVDFEQGKLQSFFRAYNASMAVNGILNAMSTVDLDIVMGL